MPTETLAYRRGTRGSHTVLIHRLSVDTRSAFEGGGSEFVASCWTWDSVLRLAGSAFEGGGSEFVAPVQSAGESQPSLRIENYLGSGSTDLPTWRPKPPDRYA